MRKFRSEPILSGEQRYPPGRLAGKLREMIVPLARQLRKQAFGRYGSTEMSVIGAIRRGGPIRLTDIATTEHLSLPTVSRAVKRLEHDGLINRGTDDTRRVVFPVRAPRTCQRSSERRPSGQPRAWLTTRIALLADVDLDDVARAIPALRRLLEAGL